MSSYDFVFAGGGLAGLSLAYHLAHSSLGDASILIVDRDPKQRNDRTWCFWTRAGQPTRFQAVVSREWERLQFAGDGWQKAVALRDYRYQMIRGLDFYRFVRQQLSARPNVAFRQANVEAVEEHQGLASVTADGERHAGRWVFDSRFSIAGLRPDPGRYYCLRQYFKGWLIETPRPAFDPHVPTLMDFRIPQQNGMRFFYVLPVSATRALVELVALSPDLADEALRAYARTVLKIDDYQIVAREGGVSPLTDCPFPRRAGQHVLRIGTAGGRVKPSSGYAFTRIQQDAAAIVSSLERLGHPFDLAPDSAHYRLCDSLMLDLMHHHAGQMQPVFKALFLNNPIERVLRFLDESASPAENAQLIASLPPKPFLQALWKMPARASLAQFVAGGAEQ